MDNYNFENNDINSQQGGQAPEQEPVNRYARPDFTFYSGSSYHRNGENTQSQSDGYATQSQSYSGQSDGYTTQSQSYSGQSSDYTTQSQDYSSQNNGYTTQSQNSSPNSGYASQSQDYSQYRTYSPYEEARKSNEAKKAKKERKPGGFGAKLAKCAAFGLVFGLVAGGVMVGVQYVAAPYLPNKVSSNSSGAQIQQGANHGTIPSTAVANTYVAVDVSDVVNEVMPSIVAITNISETEFRSFWGSQTYESTSAGSGIIVRSDDEFLYIATNNHVIDGAKTLTVTFDNNTTVSAEVKGADPSIDLAVVKVALSSIDEETKNAIKMAALGDSDSLRVGEASIAIGNALGYGQSVTMGVISAVNRVVTVSDSGSNTGYTAELVQTDAAINPGNSGGALINSRGEVIGINSVKYADTEVEGIGYAIPINTAAPIIEELITKEKVDESNSSYLGIAGVDVSDEVASVYNMPAGVYVAQVLENTAAAKYGIIQGDIITKFEGKEITSMEALTDTLQYYAAGTTVEITVMRAHNGQYQEHVLQVELGKKIN